MGLRSFYVRKLHGYLGHGLRDNALRGLRAARRNVNLREANTAVPEKLFGAAAAEPGRPRQWWERPGLGLMFQIEARPGWSWQRNFDRFNETLRGPDGSIAFDGPCPRVSAWVDLSRRMGCDYHLFEAKWHDGICYWDTAHTAWKTPRDYCREFAEASRAAGIPHGFYYSAVFDHNPDFDEIQPLRCATPSYLAMGGGERAVLRKSLGFTQFMRVLFWLMERDLRKAGIRIEKPRPFFEDFRLHPFRSDPERYKRYVLAQLEELCGSYGAELIWADWFGTDGEAASDEIMDFMETRYPEVALTFNASIIRRVRWAHFLSFETHNLESTWTQVNAYRSLKRPWELVSPAAANWDAPQPKPNKFENALTAALILAAGGKVSFGLASEMDGSLCPEVVEQMEWLGAWYASRRSLFGDALPMKSRRRGIPGVSIRDRSFRALGAVHEGDRLIHLFPLRGQRSAPHAPLELELSGPEWGPVGEVRLEPSGDDVESECCDGGVRVRIPADSLDPVDTILRIRDGAKSGMLTGVPSR